MVTLLGLAACQAACSTMMVVDDTSVLPDAGDATVSSDANDGRYPSCDGGCGPDALCAFPIAEGCGAAGACVPLKAGVIAYCRVATYCACDGSGVLQRCDIPGGYTPAPVQGAYFPCSGLDAGDAGVMVDAEDARAE